MKRRALLSLFVSVVVLSCAAFTLEVKAAEYPDKTIEFVCGGGVGTAIDTFVRGTALLLNEEGIVKPKIMAFNRIGGSGTVAINYLASKKGDPNVQMTWTTGPIVTLLRGTTTVKNAMDLTMLSSLAEEPNLLVVHADSKYKSIKDLIDYARKNPYEVKMAVGNVGGSEHLIITRIEKATGVKFNVTAFSGSAPPYTSILGGHTDFTFTGPADVLESVKAGKLRILAVAGERRAEAAPSAPTLKEEGFNVSIVQLRGFWGPPEMPDYASKFWGQAYARLSETKRYKDLLAKMAMIPAYMGPEQLNQFMPAYVNGFAADLKNLEVYGGKK